MDFTIVKKVELDYHIITRGIIFKVILYAKLCRLIVNVIDPEIYSILVRSVLPFYTL